MAHLFRLIGAVALLVFGVVAQAAIPKLSYEYAVGGDPAWYQGQAAACQAYPGYQNPIDITYTWTYLSTEVFSVTAALCHFKTVYKSSGAPGSADAQVSVRSRSVAPYCPLNSTASGTTCSCNAGYSENSTHTGCEQVDPCKALKGQSAGDWWRDTGDDNGLPAKIGFSVCDKYQPIGNGLCVATVPSTGGLCMQTEGGWWRCTGQAFYTGSKAPDATKCSPTGPGGSGDSPTDPLPATPPSGNPPVAPSQPDPNTAAPAPCGAGQAPGTFNGTSMCQPTGGDRPQTSAAPGTGATTTNNSDGSSTTTTTTGTTKCAEGQCTTSTNNTNVTINAPGNESCPAGQTSGTTTVNGQTRTTCTGTSSGTTSQAQSEFCKTHPTDKQCGGDGTKTGFGGSCAGGWKAISDDAVINAMAEETFRQNCKVNPADSETTLAAAERVKTGNQTGDNPNNASFSISPSSIDTSDALGGGSSCIADKVITVFGGVSVVVPFSKYCEGFPMLGALLVGLSFLVAGVIILRG